MGRIINITNLMNYLTYNLNGIIKKINKNENILINIKHYNDNIESKKKYFNVDIFINNNNEEDNNKKQIYEIDKQENEWLNKMSIMLSNHEQELI